MAVIDGYDGTSCFKSLSVFVKVLLGAPEPNFLFGIIPGGNDAADLFNSKNASLETPISLAFTKTYKTLTKTFLPFAFSFDLSLCLK